MVDWSGSTSFEEAGVGFRNAAMEVKDFAHRDLPNAGPNQNNLILVAI
jgi:hypothetical protein